MAKLSTGKFISIFLAIGILTGPLFDFISTYLSHIGAEFSRATLITRGVFISSAITLSILIDPKRDPSKLIKFILLATILPMSAWFILGIYSSTAFFESLAFLIKAVSLFSFVSLFSVTTENNKLKIHTIITLTLYIYMLFIIAGALFGIEMFESYKTIERFGYKGIILAQNEASGLIFVALLIVGLKALTNTLKTIDKGLLIITSIASLLLGTKPGLIMPVAILAIIYISNKGYIKALPKITTTTIYSLIIAITAYLYIPSISNAINSSLGYFMYQFENYANGSLFTLLLSGRDNKLEYAITNYILQNPAYIFTGGYPIGEYLVEIDFIDLSLMFGIPIFVIYLLGLYNIFKTTKNTKLSRYYTLAFISILLLTNTAGHILTSALLIPYLAYFIHLKNLKYEKN